MISGSGPSRWCGTHAALLGYRRLREPPDGNTTGTAVGVERSGRTAYLALNIYIKSMDDVRKRYTLIDALLTREGWMDPLPVATRSNPA